MSESRNDDARLREAFGHAGEDTGGSADCPDDETLWRVARGETDGATTGRVLDHVTGCPACTESWRMARAIADEAGVEKSNVVPLRRVSPVWMVAAVAAGILMTLLVLPSILERDDGVPADEFRVPGGVVLESRLDESTALPRDRAMLSWEGAPEGTVYSVEVVDADLAVLTRSGEQERTEFLIPAEILSSIPPGGKIYWRVEALLPDSTRVVSPVFVLELQ